MTQVRTRFAPSPTGFIHLGNIRSALYPWAYARANGGVFILRIEDTDVERSSQEAVDVILESMHWLGLDYDEGPHYQMQRMDRYKQVLAQMLERGLAYRCYMQPDELDALRERQMAAKQKPRYDGTWRPEPGKTLPPLPPGVQPVVRFRNPLDGSVVWDDKVKGRIEISNTELDDLVIARPDGTPTYNFCVVVDDIDMAITHVIRGDDHVNNTPRQINILRALGAPEPVYAHLPTVLNEQGEKMSKRHGAKAVTQYRDEGYLAGAVVNYLARLGWSHGDDEIFTREQFLQWFDLDHLGRSPGPVRRSQAALGQCAAHQDDAGQRARAARRAAARAARCRACRGHMKLAEAIGLFKDRCSTTVELADWLLPYATEVAPSAEDLAAHVTPLVKPALDTLCQALRALRMEQGVDPAGDQVEHRRAWTQDAAACDGRARARLRSPADAVDRRRAGAVPARDGARAFAALLTLWL